MNVDGFFDRLGIRTAKIGYLGVGLVISPSARVYYLPCSGKRSFSALIMLLVGWQGGHSACSKNCVVGCWRGYQSGARCRFA